HRRRERAGDLRKDHLPLRRSPGGSQDRARAGLRCGLRAWNEAQRRGQLHLLPDARAEGVCMKVTLRLRLSAHDAHYGGGLVDGARVLGLFGDVATELLIRHDGDEGLFRAYESVEFLAPLRAGDFVEVEGEIVSTGKTSRKMKFEARKYISSRPDLSDSAADLLAQPVVVCRAVGT